MSDFVQQHILEIVIGGFVCLDAIIFGVVFLAAQFRINRVRETWQSVAARTGLTFHKGSIFLNPPKLTGDYRGRPTELSLIERQDRGGITVVQLEVKNPDLLRLSLSPQDLFAGLSKLVGGKDIRLGDEHFDSRFMIQSDEPDAARRVLGDSNLRESLLRLSGDFSLKLSQTALIYRHRRRLHDADYLVAAINTLGDLADSIERSAAQRTGQA